MLVGDAVRHHRPGIFLEIVRRQHVVRRGDEGLEESHVRRAISLKVLASIFDARQLACRGRRPAGPQRYRRGRDPEYTKGSATGHDAGATATTAIPAATPKATPPAICP